MPADTTTMAAQPNLTAAAAAVDHVKSNEQQSDYLQWADLSKFSVGEQVSLGIVLALIWATTYYWSKFSFWSKQGVKNPPPLPIFGNALTHIHTPRQRVELDWRQKYGKIYGYYMGTRPHLVIADANVVRQICISDFDKFSNHLLMRNRNRFQKNFLIFQKDDYWRGMRNILSPTFTSGRIKKMFKILDSCANDLLHAYNVNLQQQQSGDGALQAQMDVRKSFSAFSMQSALNSFYGVKFNRDGDADTEKTKRKFADMSRAALGITRLRFVLSQTLPLWLLDLLGITMLKADPFEFFGGKAASIIEQRKKMGGAKQFDDYLHLLLEARAGSAHETSETDAHEDHHAITSDDSAKQQQASSSASASLPPPNKLTKTKLTENEVHCQAIMLMIVATETTSTLLSHMLFLMSLYEDVQQRLYEELVSVRENDGSFEYEKLTSCKYLDCVISETLRFMSPVLTMDRLCGEDYYLESHKIHIPKGTVIDLAYYAIHRDPEYWPEPDKFDPERFSAENKHKIKPGTYIPFGMGPRYCIGFRFALTETKIAVAKLLTQFEFTKSPKAKFPPDAGLLNPFFSVYKDLIVSYKKRS